ncbi:MAG: hypothetical protein D6705_12665 [Deltaproteobacteria bacterium]|nr:MAG: hypothetical protein D6705_12665 [Deltaproteobacteria bacterium]
MSTSADRAIRTYLYGERSQAVRYGVLGAVLVFAVIFPVGAFLIGPSMGLPMQPGVAAMFAVAGAVTFGIVAGMVAGAAERGTPRTSIDEDGTDVSEADETHRSAAA